MSPDALVIIAAGSAFTAAGVAGITHARNT